MASRILRSPKYPGWSISKVSDAEYLMVRDAGLFAIAVRPGKFGEWAGELLTRHDGAWEAARHPYTHCPMGVVREADRRAAWVEKCQRERTRRERARA